MAHPRDGPSNFHWSAEGHLTGHQHADYLGTTRDRRRSFGVDLDVKEMKRVRIHNLMSDDTGLSYNEPPLSSAPPGPVSMSRESVIDTIQTAVERGDHVSLRRCLSQCRVERAVVRDPFTMAVQNADHRIVAIFMAIDYRPNLNCMRLTDGTFPLLWAVNRNNLEMVQALLSRPLGPKQIKQIKDIGQRTPLMLAVEKGLVDMVKILLDSKFDVNTGSQCETHPLHIAARSRNVELVQLLLDYGAKPGLLSEPLRESPLMAATSLNAPDICNLTEKTRTIVGILLQRKVNLDVVDINHETALYKATLFGDPEVIHMMLEKGADPEIRRSPKDNSHDPGEGPLFVALQNKNIEVFKKLLMSGRVRLDLQTKRGHYLEYAAKPGMEEFLHLLLAAGVNPNWISGKGLTSVHQMAATGTDDMMESLVNFGANVNSRLADWTTPLMHAASHRNYSTGRVLVKFNCDLNQKDITGHDALDLLLSSNLEMCSLKFILLLLEAGVDRGERASYCQSYLQAGTRDDTKTAGLVERIINFYHCPQSLKCLCRRRLREFLDTLHRRQQELKIHLPELVISYLMFIDI